jgi:hypothetical protein
MTNELSASRLLCADVLHAPVEPDGAGTVAFEDDSAIDLRPGVLVRLRTGDRTTWTITERLRKLYLA